MKKGYCKLIVLLLVSLSVLCCFASCNPSEHTFGEWTDNTATCTEEGTETRVCTGCGYTETRVSEVREHIYGQPVITDPTCAEFGISRKACMLCSQIKEEKIQPLGHKVENGVCTVCKKSDFLVLIENGKANFNIVYTQASGATGRKAADMLVERLRALGVEINDPVSDINTAAVTDCEIIIGAGARGRGDACFVDDKHLGHEGESVKIVGSRVVIAGGTEALTRKLFEDYIENQMKITDDLDKLTYVAVNKYYFTVKLTDYPIDSIKIADVDLSKFTLITDVEGLYGYKTDAITSFRKNLYDASGYWLKLGNVSNMDSYEHSFVIRYLDGSDEENFNAYYDGKNFIVECAIASIFNLYFETFANDKFITKTGNLTFTENYLYSVCAANVSYEDYGAVGDGETCDFKAIYDAHVFANANGLKIVAKDGATYKISAENFTKSIPIKTDVDFNGATFIVDDTGSAAYRYKGLSLFAVQSDYAKKNWSSNAIRDKVGYEVNLLYGTEKIDWIVGILETKSMVRIYNSTHLDFVRHGSNESSGNPRTDIFIVDVDGTISKDTPVAYEMEEITSMEVYRLDDKPITVKNGTFYNICCQAVKETLYDCKYHAYKRGFSINRSNVTIENLTHRMLEEPKFGSYNEESGYTEEGDTLYAKYGSRHESYPYYGFLYINNTYNLTVKDSSLTSHTTYYEDKRATASTGNVVPNPVPMGSYDFVIEYSSNVTFKNVTQHAPTGLGDSRYWGIMSSNGSKNLTFDGCKINRFDAHRGFWNATLINTEIGHSFNVIGGGLLLADGVTKHTTNYFIYMRSDYGATFRGDMILKDCHHLAYKSYNTSTGGKQSTSSYGSVTLISSGFSTGNSGWSDTHYGAYWLWNFGYTCYMPKNVTIDNFTSKASALYIFNNLPDKIFTYNYDENNITKDSVKYPYQITESVIIKNNTANIKICSGKASTYTKLHSIPITREE